MNKFIYIKKLPPFFSEIFVLDMQNIGIFFLERKKKLISKQNYSAEIKTSDFVLIKVREKKNLLI